MNYVEKAYDEMPEVEWSRLERHRVEYGLTMRALADYLPSAPAAVADIGGSTGRYAIELTRRGYSVTLADVSQKCLDFAQLKAAEMGVELAGVVKTDARDLSDLADESFDAVLVMGPMYHLLAHAQRLEALREARRILRPGGYVIAAFISRFCIVQYAAAERVDYIRTFEDELNSILNTGIYLHSESSEGFPDAWFAHPDEIVPLMSEAGLEEPDLMACEPLAYCLEEGINAASPELHAQWIDLLYRLCREPSILGAGGHLLCMGKKAKR